MAGRMNLLVCAVAVWLAAVAVLAGAMLVLDWLRRRRDTVSFDRKRIGL